MNVLNFCACGRYSNSSGVPCSCKGMDVVADKYSYSLYNPNSFHQNANADPDRSESAIIGPIKLNSSQKIIILFGWKLCFEK